jgi:tRNA pseudouridine32 synthase/23S rRNA pseudouridine746 synthase
LNACGEERDLLNIFEDTVFKLPPSGAGECCAPRLLQYAFQNNLYPLCFTEFWWGVAPESEVRIQNHHYPACRGKCEPILSHMLNGVSVEENPLNTTLKKSPLTVLYEDENLLAIDKPHGMLSVPGKEVKDSVAARVKKYHPHISGPGLIHRLDYETSGVLLIAKNQGAHRFIQKQFIERSVEKKYIALLEKSLHQKTGEVLLPLRLDPFDRPRQLVCFKEGKPSKTSFKVVENKEDTVRVAFFPKTGRTHQLRVHSAHKMGLNNPIKGDRLYGAANERLFLHAESISVVLPYSNQRITITSPCPF